MKFLVLHSNKLQSLGFYRQNAAIYGTHACSSFIIKWRKLKHSVARFVYLAFMVIQVCNVPFYCQHDKMSKGPIIAQGTWYHRKLVLTIGLAIMALIQMVVISTSSFPSGKQLVFRLPYWELCFLCNSSDIRCHLWRHDSKGLNNNLDDKW